MQNPSFDTWTSIFLFAAVQGIFVSCAFFFLSNKRRERIFLAVLLLLFSITLVEYVFWWTRYLWQYPHLMNISAAFPFLYGPLLYYYFKVIFKEPKWRTADLLVLLPFIINVADMLGYYFSPAGLKQQWLSGAVKPHNFFHYWHWLQIIHMIAYALLIFRSYGSMSSTQPEVRNWFRYLFTFYILFIASFTSYYVLVLFPWFNTKYDYMISFSMMFTIYFLAWFGYLQPGVFKGFSVKETVAHGLHQQKYRNSALTPDISENIAVRLQRLMQEKKLYRESDLRLEKLADITGTGKHHLSQVINEHLGMSYFEYINSLRVEEAQKLLSENTREELNIIEVAYRVGFNNKVSFNNTFKKITGMTPTAFRKKKIVSEQINSTLN
jgi:AraC-like DNA-binding protein